jgi:hypothetical protein
VRLVVTAFVTRGHTARFSRCLACLDAPLAAAVKAACGGTDRLMAAPEVDPAVVEGVRAQLARLQARGGQPTGDRTSRNVLQLPRSHPWSHLIR